MGFPTRGAGCLPESTLYVSIYRRGSTWWIELTSHGRRIRESAGTTDKKAAQEYHEKRKGEIWRQAKLGESPPVTWGEAVAKWLKVKPRSLPERYMIAALSISARTTLPLETISLERFMETLSAGSWNRYLSLVKAIHTCAGISALPIKRRPNPQGRTRWLTAEEWQRLRKAVAEESELLLHLADFSIATGVRENNALELEWTQVDLNRRVAWFYADQMKGKVPHGIPLNDEAMAVLRSRKGLHKQFVFAHHESGLPLVKASNRAWYKALRRSRLKKTGVTWHTLRHTWASWAVMSGVRLEEVQRLGGWKSYSMVLRYAHLATEHLAESAAKVKPVSLRYNARKAGGDDTKSPTKGA
jgi:integrase